MLKPNAKKIEKAFFQQQGQSDCGVACLITALRYFGGEGNVERLRELSGTSRQGTTMLGLVQAAPQVGLEVESFTAEPEHLIEADKICLLHVIVDKTMSHYMLYFGFENDKFILSDPAKGVIKLTESELLEIWQSKALLTLAPNKEFEQSNEIAEKKKAWLWDLVKEDTNILTVSLFLGIIMAVLGLSTALFSQKLIDQILPSKEFEKLVLGLVLLTFLLLARNVVGFLKGKLLIRQNRDFNNRMINQFYTSLLYLPIPFFDNRKTGEMIARMNDTSRIQQTILYLVGSVLIDVLIVIVYSVVLLVYNIPIGLISILSIPLFFLIAYFFNAKILAEQKQVMSAYAKNESNYIDTIQGIHTIKVANKESLFAKSTQLIYQYFQQTIFQLGNTRIRFELISGSVGVVLLMAIIAWQSHLVWNEEMKLGEFVAILSIAGGVIPTASRLVLANIQIKEAKVAFDRMFEFSSTPPEQNPTANTQHSKKYAFWRFPKNFYQKFGFPLCRLFAVAQKHQH
ncbi:MAG: ATP-binding cassette subfamily B protein [Flammeovirgaceae bacterium]|jgi:ATP-binding cassette subfamily B protein